jgi:hypothetical protein
MDLHQNAAVAANVEAWISELGDFGMIIHEFPECPEL